MVNSLITLSWYKELIEYYASITTTYPKAMYTPEKLKSLSSTFALHKIQLDSAVECLQEAADKLSDTMTMQHTPVLDKIRSTQKFLKHFQVLSNEFVEEIKQQKKLKEFD